MPQIVVKQAHVVKRYCSMDRNDVNWSMYQTQETDSGYNPNINRYLKYEALKEIIYPTWDPNTFNVGKSLSFIYSCRDEYFFRGNVHVKRYNEIVDSVFKQLHDKTPKNYRFAMPASMYSVKHYI
jgi:hypothetical protein